MDFILIVIDILLLLGTDQVLHGLADLAIDKLFMLNVFTLFML